MNHYKVVLVGDAGVGKSFLLQNLRPVSDEGVQPHQAYKPTAGASCTFFDCPDGSCLYILDTAGSPAYQDFIQLYLRRLDAVVLVFALNDPDSLQNVKEWNEIFNKVYEGDLKEVSKFVLGTKVDIQTTGLQKEGITYAETIGAKYSITSASKRINVHDFFTDVSNQLLEHKSLVFDSQDAFDSSKQTLHIKDVLMEGSILVKKFPDPVLLDTSEEDVFYLKVEHNGISLFTEDRTLAWRPSRTSSSYGSGLDEIESTKPKDLRENCLLRCLDAQEPVSVWQHQWLENVYEVGAATRRQPTETKVKGIKDMAFCTRTICKMENTSDLFYMLHLTEDNNLLECGINIPDKLMSTKADIVENHFVPTPKLIKLEEKKTITSMSLTNGLAAAALSDGSVVYLGCNLNGEFDVAKHLPKHFGFGEFPSTIGLKMEVTQVACGLDFVLMLTKDGKVFSHGSYGSNCLGHADSNQRSEPAKVKSFYYEVKRISAGYQHALALDKYGTLYFWGINAGTGQCVSKPKAVYEMSFTTVTSIACGAYHSLCIGEGYMWKGNFRKRSVFSWGLGTNGALGHLVNQDVPQPRLVLHMFNKKTKLIKSVSAGRNHTAFLTDDGMVYTCGKNDSGQLGYFTESEISGKPKKVELGKNAMGIEIRAQKVICSEDCTMVTTEENRVVAWGKFSYGPNVYHPTPLRNTIVDIIDITTCKVPESARESECLCELIIALTSGSRMVLCTGVTTGTSYDYQDLPWPERAILSCNVSNLVRIASVGAVILALDDKNNCYYADVKCWVQNLVGEEVFSSNEQRVMHNICRAMEKLEPKEIPDLKFTHFDISNKIFQIEVSLDSFLLRSEIGDVFSWRPYQGSPVHHHVELDDKIVVQVACGMKHFAALTDTGHVFTCGVGAHAQLGHGDLNHRNVFEVIPLCRIEKIRSVYCGQVSTAVISRAGKVYFWGQLQVSKEEKHHEERKLLKSMKADMETPKSTFRFLAIDVPIKSSDVSRSYKINQRQEDVILVGKPLEFNIDRHSHDRITVDPNMVFRVQATSSSNKMIVKGRVECSQPERFQSTLTFQNEGNYKVSVTCYGNHVLGSPFTVDTEMGVPLSTLKMTLVGCDVVSLKSVASALTTLFGDGQEGSPSLMFPLGVRVQLWGHPPVHGNKILSDVMALASLSDGGIFLYVWDGSLREFPEKNLTFWLYQLALKAPQAHVVILGVNMSSEQAHRFDLKSFQRSNPRLKKAIFVASLEEEPEVFFKEIHQVVERRMLTETEKIVWSKLAQLETRIRGKINQGTEVMSRKELVRLAKECGIEGETKIHKSTRHLEKVGLALEVGAEDIFIILNQYWLSRQMSQFIHCCPRGAVETCHLDQPSVQLSDMLIKKKLAFTNAAHTRLFFVPCLAASSNHEEILDDSSSVVVRHLVLNCPPDSLSSAFPLLAARVCREHVDTSFSLFSCVIYDKIYKCRIAFGPCLINKNKCEIGFTIQSTEDKSNANYAKFLVHSFEKYLQEECPHLYIDPQVYVSCHNCVGYYIPLEAIARKTTSETEASFKCGECRGTLLGTDLWGGFRVKNSMPKLMESSLTVFIPDSPPPNSLTSRQIISQLVRYMSTQEERILREMNQQFETMAKFFNDLKEYDVPRTFCLLPVFEEELQVTGDILGTLKRYLLLYKQHKFRLHLLCEGNGDGTGIHFLEPSDHKGYEIRNINEFVLKSVGQLRHNLQMLTTLLQNLAVLAPLLQPYGAGYVFLTTSSISTVLGLAVNKMKEIDLVRYFNQMDKFLKGFQETANAIKQPKHLGACSKDQTAYKTSGCDYKQLREVIKSFQGIDKFGKLRQEFRKGIGGVWVCEEHAKYTNSVTKKLEIPQNAPSCINKSTDLKINYELI